MGGVIRLIVNFGKFAIFAIVAAVLIYLTIVLVNRGIQWLAAQLGYEVGDFFQWFRSKLPKRKRKKVKKTYEKES